MVKIFLKISLLEVDPVSSCRISSISQYSSGRVIETFLVTPREGRPIFTSSFSGNSPVFKKLITVAQNSLAIPPHLTKLFVKRMLVQNRCQIPSFQGDYDFVIYTKRTNPFYKPFSQHIPCKDRKRKLSFFD